MSTPFNVQKWARQAGIQITGGFCVVAECVTVDELERFANVVAEAERNRLHDKFMEIHKSQQHSNNYWHFAARKIKENL